MSDNQDAPDFQGALAEEFGLTPAEEETTQPEAIPTAEESANAEDIAKSEPEAEPEKPAEPEPEAPAEEEKPTYATKDDVKDAMREYNKETTGRVDSVYKAREEIISKVYPEGIDRSIYDSDGKAIKTAQDIVDRGLMNERTGDPYSYEEAASFILEATQKMNQNIEELNGWADNIAEQNISLAESSKRVLDKWGDVLTAMPDIANELAEKYMTTQLEFDKTGSYITKMSMTPEAFYDITAAPYRQLSEALASKELADAENKKQDDQSEQSERSGLPPQRGESDVKANTGDPMVDALLEEMKKG